MICSSNLESSLREAIPQSLRDLHLFVSGFFFYGKEEEAGVMEDSLICEGPASCLELVNPRLLWKFEHFLATYL